MKRIRQAHCQERGTYEVHRKKYTGKMDSTMYCGIFPSDFDLNRHTMTDIAEMILHDMSFDRKCYENLRAREREKMMREKDQQGNAKQGESD